LPPDEAAPLLCAGITTFNSLRNSGARAGDVVAIQGMGGLGHLGIQYARQMGFRTVAIGRDPSKADLARKLGAVDYLDSTDTKTVESFQKRGGARLILATAPYAKAITDLIHLLSPTGKLLVVAAPGEPLSMNVVDLLSGRFIQGWPSGTAKDSEDTLQFSSETGVRPMIEKYPLEKAADAYQRMLSGRARFRVVLTT
jgi:D-arabinose 1-dehydrogenase-like Zn-dependent alcohol dehydrogenase